MFPDTFVLNVQGKTIYLYEVNQFRSTAYSHNLGPYPLNESGA